MIAVTLDVNVLVSGFPASHGALAVILERWLRRDYELVVSEHFLTEAAEAWETPYWAARYSADRVQQALALLRERATFVVPASTVRGVGEDEEDDLVLATAIAGGARFLVTGDRHLQGLGGYRDVAIVSPRRFLDILNEAASDEA